ncbi:MAG: TatD family hydrolase [Motiliproteus sp.]|nr:TatD family hydrolase [Motiliproteus sp.]MCW9050694.1 TatD family hydrolase [Motiliproteus sp.]
MQSESFFDTHCHFDFECFDDNRQAIWEECQRQGVRNLLIPGVVAADWQRLSLLCEAQDGWHFGLGMHPCFLDQHRPEHLVQLRSMLLEYDAVAVAEIGLDFWHGTEKMDEQIQLFSAQLAIAKEADLPVLLHVRKAHDQVLKLLRQFKLPRAGIVHAFSGSQQQAEHYIQLGFKLGVGGAITYPRAQRLRRQVVELPLDAWVLETDAPDMPLLGHQGEINSPANIPVVFEELASLREESREAIMNQLLKSSLSILCL